MERNLAAAPTTRDKPVIRGPKTLRFRSSVELFERRKYGIVESIVFAPRPKQHRRTTLVEEINGKLIYVRNTLQIRYIEYFI